MPRYFAAVTLHEDDHSAISKKSTRANVRPF